MRCLALLPLVLLLTPAAAQVLPRAEGSNPRIQTVQSAADQAIQLAAIPDTDLLLVFPPTQRIASAEADTTTITPERNAVVLTPHAEGERGGVRVTTDRHGYRFSLRTGRDLLAANVVEVTDNPRPARLQQEWAATAQYSPGTGDPQSAERWWSYRVKGEDALKPVGIRDDGEKTYILFSPNQFLPAIFAISPTGDETLTNGYMRGATFVIDRVWKRLVFRIDGKKATARRNELPDE